MRTITILSAWLLAVSTAAADQSKLLTDAQQLNDARHDRITREIGLQRTIVTAKTKLLNDGYASPLEVDVAQLKLAKLQAMRAAVRTYDGFLDHLARGCGVGSTPVSADQFVIAVAVADSTAPTRFFPYEAAEEVHELSSEIAEARRSARGQLQAIEAEAHFLERLIRRLKRSGDNSPVTAREAELARLRLGVARSRMAMGEARQKYEATREELFRDENRIGFAIEFADRTIDHAAQLAQALEAAWQDHLIRALADTAAAHLDFRSKYRTRLTAIHHRPPRHNVLAPSAAMDELVKGAPHSVAQIRERIKKLTRLANEDALFANELQRAELEFAVALAREAIARQSAQREQLADRVASAIGQATVDTVSTESAAPCEALAMLYGFETECRAARELADSRAALLRWKLDNLRPLRKIGYASWKEVAIAERDLVIAKAHQVAADEQQHIAELQVRRARLIKLPSQRPPRPSESITAAVVTP